MENNIVTEGRLCNKVRFRIKEVDGANVGRNGSAEMRENI